MIVISPLPKEGYEVFDDETGVIISSDYTYNLSMKFVSELYEQINYWSKVKLSLE